MFKGINDVLVDAVGIIKGNMMEIRIKASKKRLMSSDWIF